jgi:hypothetical protein
MSGCLAAVLVARAALAQAPLSDDEIRRRIVHESVASYAGTCPCPESINAAGHRCGRNSAYSRPGGATVFCYVEDVTKEMVDQYRQRLASK